MTSDVRIGRERPAKQFEGVLPALASSEVAHDCLLPLAFRKLGSGAAQQVGNAELEFSFRFEFTFVSRQESLPDPLACPCV